MIEANRTNRGLFTVKFYIESIKSLLKLSKNEHCLASNNDKNHHQNQIFLISERFQLTNTQQWRIRNDKTKLFCHRYMTLIHNKIDQTSNDKTNGKVNKKIYHVKVRENNNIAND